jgi:serine/threonine protein kinase
MLDSGQVFEVGRGREADIQLKGLGVSRRHLALELRPPGALYATDLGSSNGTQVRDVSLEPDSETPVAEGEPVTVGPYTLTMEITTHATASRNVSAEQDRVQSLVEPIGIEIRYLVGKGGTGTVWAGWQKALRRMVAVKVLDVFDLEDKQRFVREGRVSARIRSPNVVKLFDFRMPIQGRPFLVMELVPGMSALERLRDGPLSIREALEIGVHTTRAMEALDESGVIHRDIKPSNILLAPDGTAKLSDFGIARDLNSETFLTQAGVGLGTFSYMAPEQFQEARAVDQTADVYGLGATLYHLIAGQPPFYFSGRGNPAEFVERILNEDPASLTELRVDCPEAVSEYVLKMLAKVPDQRPASAALVHTVLIKLVADHFDSGELRRLTDSSGETWAPGS